MASQIRRPTAVVGARDNWALGAGASKVVAVQSNDGDTTYIERVNSDGQQSFTFTAFDIPAGASIEALVWTAVIKEQAGALAFRPLIRVNGTDYNLAAPHQLTAAIGIDGSYRLVEYVMTSNPDIVGTAAWLIADIEGAGGASNPLEEMSIFASSVGAGEELRCTELFLMVLYDQAFHRGIQSGGAL